MLLQNLRQPNLNITWTSLEENLKECLAVVWALKKYWPLLEDDRFTLGNAATPLWLGLTRFSTSEYIYFFLTRVVSQCKVILAIVIFGRYHIKKKPIWHFVNTKNINFYGVLTYGRH
jgi:hypothetical protein